MPTVSPVMYVAWSEQRNATVFATSSGAPARRRGMDLARLSADSSPFARRSISASSRIRVPTMRPGAMALTHAILADLGGERLGQRHDRELRRAVRPMLGDAGFAHP